MNKVAWKTDVHAEWRQKLSNKFGYSKQFVKLSKINVYICHVFGSPEGRFGIQLDTGSNLESSWAQVVQKVAKKTQK